MKFWELVSAFRSERSVLDTVFAQHPESNIVAYYKDFDNLVAAQDRSALDSRVPNVLVLAVASRSTQTFLLSDNGSLCISQDGINGQVLSALEVVKRFGGSTIEEVHERGSVHVGG